MFKGTPENRLSAIASFERWQRSPWRHYARGKTRAPRVTLSAQILYRGADERRWRHAHVLNLSETGVLFAPARLKAGRNIEVIVSPPVAVGALSVGRQLCIGEIVRVTAQGAAARFDECRFLQDA